MSVLTPPLENGGRLRRMWGLHVSLGHGGGGVGAHWGPLVLSSMTSERIQRSEKGGEAGSDPRCHLWVTQGVVLGRGCAVLIRIAPWRGLGSGSVSCCCFSARTAAYSTRLCEEVCTTEEWENEGRIHASAKQQHLNPSNDALEPF